MSSVERFWAKVQKNSADECWLWLAALTSDGHGRVKWERRCTGAHRVAYQLEKGPIPTGLMVRHTCDVARCVNPAHLILGTAIENNADRMARSQYKRLNREPVKAARRWKPGVEPRPAIDRLKESLAIMPSGCWEWQKARFHWGHGAIGIDGKTRKAHRVAYEVFVGPIPKGMQVLHACDNPPCCNPDHLRLGTHADNMAEMAARGRAATGTRNHFGRTAYRGVENARSKLTEDAVRLIRAGVPTKEIMSRFGVAKATVSHVRVGRAWKHVAT